MNRFLTRASPLALAAALLSPVALGCATCGCTLSSDAAMGYASSAGWRLSLEYDYLQQDELRHGTQSASTVPVGDELEHDTLNRYFTAGLSYSPNAVWNIDLRVPYVVRFHSTYGDLDAPVPPLPELNESHSSSLGDIKLIGSYQGFLPTHNLGVQLGVKLPTGQYGTAVNFYSGPQAGTPVDASLQPGTGSTDLIVGAYYFQAVSQNVDVTANVQFQGAAIHELRQFGNDFRPGNSTTMSLGLRYEEWPAFVPQVQLNLLHKDADQGALADRPDTAGTVAYLSPGLTARARAGLYLFGFVQVPVVSNLSGYQLFPKWTASVGASFAF
jgi:hypothetical protein